MSRARHPAAFAAGGLLAAALALLAAVALTPGRPAGAEPVPLVAGCQIVSVVAYPAGTPLLNVTNDIEGGAPRLWFLVPGTGVFNLFDPASAERSTQTTLGAGDEGAFLCVDAPTTWNRGDSADGGPPPQGTTPTTATPTPGGAVPTATPTFTVQPPEVNDGYTFRAMTEYTGDSGFHMIVGEIANGSGNNVTNLVITVDYFDSNGDLLVSGVGIPCLFLLANGGDSPFEAFLFGPPPPGATRVLEASGSVTGATQPAGIEITPGASSSDGEGYHLTGQVKNGSGQTRTIAVCGAIYDAAGNVLRQSLAATSPASLAHNQTGSFDIVFEFSGTPASHRLWTDAS